MSDKDPNPTIKSSVSLGMTKPATSRSQAEFPKRPDGKAGTNAQPGEVRPQPASKPKTFAPAANDKPKPTPREARQTYFKWQERLEARALEDQETRLRLESTKGLASRLEEPNLLAVYRLVEIFGLPLVEEMVDRAIALHNKAQEQGEEAYKPKENPRATRSEQRYVGTEVATAKGAPRTLGGIFFFITRGHVSRIRLAWEDLRIPWLPEMDETDQGSEARESSQTGEGETGKPSDKTKIDKAQQSSSGDFKSETLAAAKVAAPLNSGPNANTSNPATRGVNRGSAVASASGEQVVKPSRGKVVITGSPKTGSQPKTAPQGLAGVLELLFEIEPGSNPPKGLPVLEKTLVKVWVTEKQYSKIKDTLTPASRFLIEGEIGAGINGQNFEPFIRVICTRLTTLELEQEAKQKKVTTE